jgi:transglutaminase-like putative cysteine protease
MIKAWFKFLQGLKRAPEDSGWFRFWVGVNVCVALVATSDQLGWPTFFWPCLALTGLGMGVSHRLRRRNNWEIKAGLSILMVLALGNFFYGLAHNFYDPREPLAQLLMWLQALHSCDLPTRKDLSYSLLSALILMAVAAVLSVDLFFSAYLILYYLTAVVAMRWNVRSLVAERTGWRPVLSRDRAAWGVAFRLGLSVLLCGLGVVMLMPRLEAFKIRALPMSWQMRLKLPTVSRGEVQNPYYPARLSKDQLRQNSTFNPDGYSGFSALVDLQTRGKLAHQRVFQVRTNVPCYFRGLTFDSYDGRFWSQSDSDLRTLNVENPPFSFSPTATNPTDIVQIFYIDRPLANLVFFSPEAYQVFFPSQMLYLDGAGCLRAPFTLDKDMVYSVVSRQSHMAPERLRRLPRRDAEMRQLGLYLKLPPQVPPRVGKLAREIVGSRRGNFEQALALSLYLQTHFTYNLEVARYPEESEVVDHFLFESRQGYCEHFASALTVMCRARGIPARYCTGFLPGTYNPFSGFREVYGDEAHAWVEVYLPGYGWMTFDPTPGSDAAPELSSQTRAEERWLGLAIARYLSQQLGLRLDLLAWWAGGIGVGLLLVAGVRALTLRSPQDPIVAALQEALSLLGERPPGRSPRQHAAGCGWASLHQLVELHEATAYAGRPTTAQQRVLARQLLTQLKKEVAAEQGFRAQC